MQNPSVAGNLSAAAQLLGIDYNRADKIAKKDSYLKAMQPAVDASKLVPTSVDVVNRGQIAPNALEEARALLKQDKLLVTKDWTGLGLSEGSAKKMLAMERFANLPLIHSIKTTHGGMMFAYSRLMSLLEKYADELESRGLPGEDVMVNGEPQPRNEGDVERDWLHAIVSVSAEIRQVNGQLQKGQLLLLKAKQIEKELGKGKGGKPRKGPPIQVLAQPGSTVHLNAPQDPANGK